MNTTLLIKLKFAISKTFFILSTLTNLQRLTNRLPMIQASMSHQAFSRTFQFEKLVRLQAQIVGS